MRVALADVPVARQHTPADVVNVNGEIYLSAVTPDVGIRSVGLEEGGLATGIESSSDAEKLRNEVF